MVRYFTWGAAALEDNDNSHSCCPININLLCMLKTQLAGSNLYTFLEQHLLWAAFSLAFYGFMRVNEFASPSSLNSFSPPVLHWSDVEFLSSSILLTPRQSKIDPLQKGKCVTITATNTSIFPLFALHCYANLILLANQSGPLFSGIITPSPKSK